MLRSRLPRTRTSPARCSLLPPLSRGRQYPRLFLAYVAVVSAGYWQLVHAKPKKHRIDWSCASELYSLAAWSDTSGEPVIVIRLSLITRRRWRLAKSTKKVSPWKLRTFNGARSKCDKILIPVCYALNNRSNGAGFSTQL